MPSPFQSAGAAVDPSRSAPLHTNRFFTGLWTQRSPLRDAATSYLDEKYYAASRYDSLIAGANTEVTTRLTLARRPGSSVYNSATLPPFNDLFDFRTFVNGAEVIRVIGDFQPDVTNLYGTVRDVTGPSGNTILWVKLPGSGITRFQAVGDELFFVDGVSANKMVLSTTIWQASTYFLAGSFIVDPANNLQEASSSFFAGGTSGTTMPTWATSIGSQVSDGSLVWTCKGPNVETLGFAGSSVAPSVTVYPYTGTSDDPSVFNLSFWSAGTHYTSTRVGLTPPSMVLDNNQNAQLCLTTGYAGATVPLWSTVINGTTQDGPITWRNLGPFGQLGTAAQSYAYAPKNSLTKHVGTASPLSTALVVPPISGITVGGTGFAASQIDQIVIYRTLMGGSTLFELTVIANPGAGVAWSFLDTTNDQTGYSLGSFTYAPPLPQLNIFIQAQIAGSNNPPPAGLSTLDYHLGCLWGFSGNVLSYSGGPNTLSGSGLEAWPANNTFTLPAKGIRTWATSIGLVVFTQSDMYIVLGQNTASSPLYITTFQQGVGLLGFDAFAVNGSTAYIMTTAQRLLVLDPGAGDLEYGFPIGDLLSSYTSAAKLVYHEGSSADTALYAADGTVGWYRLSTITAPEQGNVWSPQAQVTGGCSAVASIEILPGVKKLLIATSAPGPILMRDATQFADNGTAYPAFATIGSLVLAQPGQLAGIKFITTDSIAVGTRPAIGLLLGELSGTFDSLMRNRQDPPLLTPATTIWGDRYYMQQSGRPAWCRHMQVKITWPSEAAANELLTYTIFGEIKNDEVEA